MDQYDDRIGAAAALDAYPLLHAADADKTFFVDGRLRMGQNLDQQEG
jgi:hypothetical protein